MQKGSVIIIDIKTGINKEIKINNKDTYESEKVAVSR